MKSNPLGRTGIEVTEVGFGAWAIGSKGYGQVQRADAEAAVEAYLEAGGNFIDTARGYGNSEEILGELLSDRADGRQVLVASKTPACDEQGIREAVETSLKLLGRDAVDLYYLHRPPEEMQEIADALGAMSKLKQEGKIRAVGASIKGADVTDKTTDLCRAYIQTGQVDAIQLIYSIFRQKTREVFEPAAEAGVGIVARTNLESGFLTGKYKPGETFDDHRARWGEEHLSGILREVQRLEQMPLPEGYESLAQVALKFALMPAEVTTIIPGAKNRGQAMSNTKVADLPPLPEEMVAELRDRYAGRTEQFNTAG